MLGCSTFAAGKVLIGLSLWMADPVTPTAVTRVEQADADFAVQGEYTGLFNTGCGCQQFGLQIVASGQGRFDGHLYPGGLPGAGYFGGPKYPVKGEREGDLVRLSANSWQLAWTPAGAVNVSSAQNHPVGRFQRVIRQSPTMGAQPPAHAVVLFNGSDTGRLMNAQISEEGLLQVGAETRDPVTDFTLHGEFKVPYMPEAKGQARGNSGFYLQRRYEVQVLDSFGLDPAFNDAAALYRFKAPDINMSLPPLSWQTYDIQFTAARFDTAGVKISPASITVWHNGVIVQNCVVFQNKTGGGRPEGSESLPILFQNHGNPVEYRNLWLVETTPRSPQAVVAATAHCLPAICERPALGWRIKSLRQRLLK